MKKDVLYLLAFLWLATGSAYGQGRVAITIDDIPKPGSFTGIFQDELLRVLDSVQIPIAVFINEGKIYEGDAVTTGFALLDSWIKRPYTTIGNHSFSHLHYSEVGFDRFTADVQRGRQVIASLAKKYHKEVSYFRFPFNDLGSDSAAHAQIAAYLAQENYRLAPITIDSEDWMYNYLYEYYLYHKEAAKAEAVAGQYIAKTMWAFGYYEQLALKLYGRAVDHIYLCHDNVLNARFLPRILQLLRERHYTFISLNDALADKVYAQQDIYYKKWGISWLYRWVDWAHDQELKDLMKQEPDDGAYTLYETLSARQQ